MGSQFKTRAEHGLSVAFHPVAAVAADREARPAAVYEPDVLVIGAGRHGSLAASAAAALGAQVLVLDLDRAGQVAGARGGTRGGVRGVHWLGQHHGLELLLDEQGRVRGAAGVSGLPERPWRALAGAVVLAGSDTWLMGAEARQAAGREPMHEQEGGFADGEAQPLELPGLFQAQGAGDPAAAGRAAAVLALQQTLLPAVPAQGAAVDAAAALRLRPTGRAGLRGPGRHAINPFAVQAAVQALTRSEAGRAGASPGAELARLDALWQLLLAAAPAPQGALSASRAAAECLALARRQARQRLAQQSQPVHRHHPQQQNALPAGLLHGLAAVPRLRAFAC